MMDKAGAASATKAIPAKSLTVQNEVDAQQIHPAGLMLQLKESSLQ